MMQWLGPAIIYSALLRHDQEYVLIADLYKTCHSTCRLKCHSGRHLKLDLEGQTGYARYRSSTVVHAKACEESSS